MPTYTYRCQKCGEEFERFQSMSDPPVKRCPTCKGKVQRTFHPVGIVLKGSGFHRTDYKSSSRKAGESKDKPPEKTSEKTGEKKTETKTETKSSETSKSPDSKSSQGSSSD